MADENLFDTNTPENYVDKLVGEGKKYKDANELAKAYLHADDHIRTVTQDTASYREELKSMRELLEAQAEARRNPNNQQNVNPDGNKEDDTRPAGTPKVEEVDLKTRIREALQEENEENRAKKNSKLTSDVMIERFGSKEDAVKAIEARAAELEVSPKFIADMAFQSPNAFFSTMGIDTKKPVSTNSPSSSSDVNSEALRKANPGLKPNTYDWYQQIRKTDKSKFFSVDVQSRMMADAQNNPNFFTKT